MIIIPKGDFEIPIGDCVRSFEIIDVPSGQEFLGVIFANSPSNIPEKFLNPDFNDNKKKDKHFSKINDYLINILEGKEYPIDEKLLDYFEIRNAVEAVGVSYQKMGSEFKPILEKLVPDKSRFIPRAIQVLSLADCIYGAFREAGQIYKNENKFGLSITTLMPHLNNNFYLTGNLYKIE